MRETLVYLTLKRAAQALGVHEQTLRAWEKRGLIRMVRLPGSRYRRVPVEEVERLKREMTSAPTASAARPEPPQQDTEAKERAVARTEASRDEPANPGKSDEERRPLYARASTVHEPPPIFAASTKENPGGQNPETFEREERSMAVLLTSEEYRMFQAWRRSRSWREEQLTHLQAERNAFQELLPELLKTHAGQFVAVHNGCVVDSDADEGELAWRVIVRGLKPVYIGEVRAEHRVYEVPSLEVIPHVSL